MKIAKTKLEFIFTKDWLSRVSLPEGDDDKVTIDLHYLSCKEAEKIVRDVIALTSGNFTMELIHGYNNGTSLKEFIYKTKISNRIIERKSPGYNLGVTLLSVAA